MISCPKCGKSAWKLADCTTNRSGYWRYDYARYRHPKRQYGKVKTCYVLKGKVCRITSGETKLNNLCPRHARDLHCGGYDKWMTHSKRK